MTTYELELTQKPFIELQIEALVQETRIKSKKAKVFIDELEKRILAIKDLNYDKLLNRTFRLPLLGRPNGLDDDYPSKFKFLPPERLDIVGGFSTRTSLKRDNVIDLVVEIPAKCFEKKDVKNQRYQHKRALYLCQLAHLLNGQTGLGLVEKLEFAFHRGDFLKPVLLITPSSPKILKKKSIVFQLFACPDPDFDIKLSMLHPLHGNVAPKWFFKNYHFNTENDELKEFIESDSNSLQTPFYNSSILFDIETLTNSNVISEQIGSSTSITEALTLLKIWLYQRELHKHFSFILSMFLAYLQTKHLIHQNMSSYQIFKTTIKSLLEIDWSTAGLSYFEDSQDKLTAFKTIFPVVFLSPSGYFNLCYNITIDLYHRLRHEAKIAHDIYNSNTPDTFELLFLRKLSLTDKFDAIVRVPKCTKKIPEKIESLMRFADHGVAVPRILSESIIEPIQKALTDRVLLVQQDVQHLLLDKKWNLKSIPYDPTNQDQTFTLGLLLDAEKSLRIIDIGPDAQSPEAEEFRQFWDPKCQLRLQNGIISETVVWHIEAFSQRRAIIKYILTHALKRASVSNMVFHYTTLEKFINLDNVCFRWRDEIGDNTKQDGKRRHPDNEENEHFGRSLGTGEEVFQKILNSYNELNKVLRNIRDMKHSITSIQPTSPHLRACGVFPPLPVSLQGRNKSLKKRKGVTLFSDEPEKVGKILYIEPIKILVTLDSTSKWPSDFESFQASKLDYLIKLGEALKEKDYSVRFSEDFLDILVRQFVFRVRIKCQKELSLSSASQVKHYTDKKKLEYEILPRIHGALDQMYRERPAFGLTCRLAKRWLSCNLLTDQMNEIAIELIVAHIFLHPYPYTEPASSLSGFKRFLMIMSTHDWKEDPLVINFDKQLKIDEINRIKQSMQEDRSKFPPMVICTPFDKGSRWSTWTRSEPTIENLELICKICTKASAYLDEKIIAKYDIDECKALFRPNFKLFDLVIKLEPSVIQTFFMSIDAPRKFRLSGIEPTDKSVSAFKVMPVVGLNIVEQFIGILRDKYNNVATFFYDKYGQRVIGVMMRPESEKILAGDMNGFIKDIKKLGAQIVESVKVRSSA